MSDVLTSFTLPESTLVPIAPSRSIVPQLVNACPPAEHWLSPDAAATWIENPEHPVGSPAWIDALEAQWLHLPQVEIPIVNRFADGVYLREMQMPANNLVIGNEHIFAHHNILLSGRASVLVDGQFHQLRAGSVFTCTAGVRKVIVSHEDLRWITIHATRQTDPELAEAELVRKSKAWLDYHKANQANQANEPAKTLVTTQD